MSTRPRLTRRRNPPIANSFTAETRARLRLVGIAGLGAIGLRLLLGDAVDIPVIIALLAVTMWHYPPATAMIIGIGTMILGGSLLFIAPPAIVLLARWWNRRELAITRSLAYSATSLVWAAVALLLSLLFISMTAGQSSGGGGASSGSDSTIARIVRRLFGLDGGEPAELQEPFVLEPEQVPPPDERDWSWLWWLLLVAGVVLIGVLVWWWLSNRRHASDAVEAAVPLARLEAVGARLGMRRHDHEGAIDYGQRLAGRTGDPRLGGTGHAVSGSVYESATADAVITSSRLGDLETAPPDLVKVPLGIRLRRAVAWLGQHRRRVIATVVITIALVVIAILIVSGLGSFDDPPGFALTTLGEPGRPDG